MLQQNQIKRLILQTQLQLDSLKKNNLLDVDPGMISYRRGFIAGLKLVLEMDPATINNKPINNKEINNDIRQANDQD